MGFGKPDGWVRRSVLGNATESPGGPQGKKNLTKSLCYLKQRQFFLDIIGVQFPLFPDLKTDFMVFNMKKKIRIRLEFAGNPDPEKFPCSQNFFFRLFGLHFDLRAGCSGGLPMALYGGSFIKESWNPNSNKYYMTQ
ncbi:MAG: hypothetical protein HGA66_06170 [Holophaga sp.]|nr:hypothetical protein [Holophaga sp.]